AALDYPEAVPDGMRSRRARGAGGRIWALGPEPDRDLAGGKVNDRGRNEERGYAPGTTLKKLLMFALDHAEPADARSDIRSYPVSLILRDRQAGIVHRFLRGCDCEVNEDVHLFGFLLLDELQGVKVLHLAGYPHGKIAGIESRNRSDAAPA